jgi:anti-anti-sigma factor
MNQFNLTWEIIQSFPIIFLGGYITSDTEQLLEETYHAIMDQIKTKILIFDFSKINYINSSGISSLLKIIHIHHEANGGLIFTGLSDYFRKVMDIVELTDNVKVFETIDMAIEYCKDEF